MNEYIKQYINKLFSYMPVAIFVYTLLIILQLTPTVTELNAEYGAQALDEFAKLYLFYFYRTIILALLLPLYDSVFTLKKVTYKNAILLHCLLVTTTVGILVYKAGMPVISLIISIGMSFVIYGIIWLIIYLREKQFISEANKIFQENQN